MKKIKFLLILFLVLFISCSTERYYSRRSLLKKAEIEYVLVNSYPQLYTYYDQGLLKIRRIDEYILDNGNVDYKIDYKFVRYYYYNYHERMEILHLEFPELYQLYSSGLIEIRELYKYVDKRTWKIAYHVSYRRIYDLYYDDYHYLGHSRYRYRPRPNPPRVRYEPTPPPPPRNDVRPNNPPRNDNVNPRRVPNNSSNGSQARSNNSTGSGNNNVRSNSSSSRSSNGGSTSRSGSNTRRK